jgi:SUMO ligase MMS21 Smc5/6 complex component
LKRKGWPIEHDDLRIDVIELTESQGTPDWFLTRRFVSTSTSQIEINRAVSLIGIENLEVQEKFNDIKKILHMRGSIPTAEDAPENIKDFLLALEQGGAIDTSANEWWKLKFNDKAITGTQHINPALAHLGVKVQALYL